MLKVRLLGQFDVQLNDEPVEIPSRPAQSLLAYLMLHAGTAQRRERLAGLLWPDASESNARANLRQALWLARKAMGADYILSDRVSVTFDVHAEYWLDSAVLESQPLAGGSADDLIQAVSVYAGELLPGFYDEWVTWERERLNAVYEDRVQALLERLVGEQRWGEVHDWAERWIAGGQVPEPAYRALMRAHAGLGDRAGMGAAYQRCVEALKAELGVAPSQETEQLFQRLSWGEAAPRPPVVARPPQRRSNLPTPPTPFVGREALLAEIAACLQEPACRLLTLVGPGGCGKTRLALEAAAARLDAHEHGVFFVSLAPLESVEEIVPAVAQALGFTFYGAAEGGETVAPRQQLLDYLRNKHMLLVMDNYEHLLASPSVPPTGQSPDGRLSGGQVNGGTFLLTDILQTAPQIKILATSRANLNLQNEHLFPIAGMDVPDTDALGRATDYSAVKLFLEAARRTQPRFAASADNLRDVVRICRLVDGMPLGVLLAAGWVRTLNLAEIAIEIEQGLDFLATDLQDVPERQRSVRAVFDHSWKLLTDQEQDVLAQLSVFRGGFTRRATQAVTGATLRHLKGLVDKSLLDHTTTGRYQVHELLRQYAAERLARAPERLDATRDRHAAYYAGFLARRAEQLKGTRQHAALAEIEADADNARAAWNWAVERGQAEWLDQGMEGLCVFYELRGRYEQGFSACATVAARWAKTESGDGMRIWVRTLVWQSVFAQYLGKHELAHQLALQSLDRLDHPTFKDLDTRSEEAFALRQMGSMALWSGDYGPARRWYEQSLALCGELGDRWGTAVALRGLGFAAWSVADYDIAIRLYRESLALWRALNITRETIESLSELSNVLVHYWQPEEAERLARESVALARKSDDRFSLALALHYASVCLLILGKWAESLRLGQEAVSIWGELGCRAWFGYTSCFLPFYQLHQGLYEGASDWGQIALKIGREIGSHRVTGHALLSLGWVSLGEAAYAEALGQLEEAVAIYRAFEAPENLAYTLTGLAITEHHQGNLGQARAVLSEALRTAGVGSRVSNLMVLAGIALLKTDRYVEVDVEQAVELYALVSRYPFVGNSQWWEDVVGQHIMAAAASLPPDVVAAAQERGRARDMEATLRELLDELDGEGFPRWSSSSR